MEDGYLIARLREPVPAVLIQRHRISCFLEAAFLKVGTTAGWLVECRVLTS